MRSAFVKLLAGLSFALALSACAGLTLPSSTVTKPASHLLYAIFQDHAVLQRDQPIPVWGSAAPGETVTVSLAGESATATAGADGRWLTHLGPLPAGGPYVLTAQAGGGAAQSVSDILMGDVWLCSGQSNMEFPVRRAMDSDLELEAASRKDIRLLQVDRASATHPLTEFGGKAVWSVASPDTAKEFSAACFFFGRELQPAVGGVPLGLINASWGGSSIQAWMSRGALQQLGGYDQLLGTVDAFAANTQKSLNDWRDFVAGWWRANDPGSMAAPPWSAPEFDDNAWPEMLVAGDWENAGIAELRSFDGIVWFRTRVAVSEKQAKEDATLTLGPVDDDDITWLNGVRIGSTEGWDVPRSYTVPAGTLKPGENLLAVGVFDGGAGGGIYGPASGKALHFADGSTVMLPQTWRWRIAAPLKTLKSTPPVPPWFGANGTTNLYNGMIAPLGPTGLKGMIWYQGEANVDKPSEYGRLLPAMIADWRRQFGAAVPFLIVQLPNYGPASADVKVTSGWPELREAQRLTAAGDPTVGLAVAIDTGSRFTIHPTDKQEVGHRLALLAERIAYGQSVVAGGPEPVAVRATGKTVVIDFRNAETALRLYGYDRPVGFELCDAQRLCRFAGGTVQGDSVTLDASQMKAAAFVRFCWADSPLCNLYNAEGLPAVPFELAIPPAAGPPRAAPAHKGQKPHAPHKTARTRRRK